MVAKKKNRSLDALVDAINTTRVVYDGSRGGVGFRDGVVVPEPRSGGSGITSTDGARQLDFLTSPSYAGVLQKFGLDGSKFMQLLAELGISTGRPMSDVQQDDWNKQLLDSMLAAASEQDARNFNIKMRDEQRVWDSPTNQLARLMGAGISRDAAIQMLSGGSSGSGAGSVTGAAAPMSSGIPASQSTLNDIQGKTAIAGVVFGGLSAVTGLASLGISIPSAIAQVTAMNIGNALNEKTLIGLQSADALMSAFENAIETGVLSTADIDGFKNGTDAINYAFEHKDTDVFRPLFENGSFANVYGTKLGREMFSQLWKTVRSSQTDGTILDNYIKQQELQNVISQLQTEQIGAEISKIGSEESLNYQSVIESMRRVAQIDANIQVLDKQGKWIDIQSKWQPRVWQADISRTQAETSGLNIENAINEDVFEINHAGVPMLKQAYIDKCSFAMYHASVLNDPHLRQEYWASWLMDGYNAHALAWLKYAYNNAVGDFARENPNLFKLMQGFSYSGGFDAIKSAAELGGDAAGVAGAARTAGDLLKYIPK